MLASAVLLSVTMHCFGACPSVMHVIIPKIALNYKCAVCLQPAYTLAVLVNADSIYVVVLVVEVLQVVPLLLAVRDWYCSAW